MIVRLFTSADLPRVEEILLENGMNTSLAPRQYVAVAGDDIVGTGGIWPMDRWSTLNSGWLSTVAVAKKHKRTGVGRAVVTANLEHAAFCEYDAVWLETYFWNSRFYESLGFNGVIPNQVPPAVMAWRVNKHCRFMCHPLATSAS